MDVFQYGIVPVVVLHNRQEADIQLNALMKGGLPVAEITFRTDYAAEGIAYCAENFPQITVGAGTVVNAAQALQAIGCGAKFIVSPGFSASVAEVCRKNGTPYLPGCVTPTEIMLALEAGITTVKFFPANVYGGLAAIKALAAPFTQVKFLPTGGVNGDNLAEFLSYDRIAAVGGSWMMKGSAEEMEQKIRAAVQTAKEIRK